MQSIDARVLIVNYVAADVATMKKVLLSIMMMLAGCDQSTAPVRPAPASAPATEPAGQPIILIDTLHSMRGMPGSAGSGKPYLLDSSAGVTLDVGRYTLTDPKGLGRIANVVQVLFERSEYKAEWPGGNVKSVELNSSTLHALKGDAFTGFASGKQAIVAVGYRDESKGTAAVFDPFWVGQIIFK